MFLEVKHISKQIGMDEVLKDITISMEKGKVYGFQGEKWMRKINVDAGDLRISHSYTWQCYH